MHPRGSTPALLAGALLWLAGCGAGAQDAAPAAAPAPCGVPGAPPCDAPAGGPAAAAEEKTRQCNALIEVINQAIRDLERIQRDDSDPSGISDLRAMAAALDRVVAAASGVRLSIPELRKASQDYQEMSTTAARAARIMADAAEARDRAGVEAAQTILQEAVAREDPLVDRLNAFCKEP
jgi:hypothetical protein